MDQITYDQRYQYQGQAEYWPYGYSQQVAPNHEQPNYVSNQAHNFQYNHHSQAPRQMTPSEWMLAVQQNQNPHPQAFGQNDGSHHYVQTLSTPSHTPTPNYMQQSQPPTHAGMVMAAPGTAPMLTYPASINGVAYYSNGLPHGLLAYPSNANTPTQYGPTTAMLPTAATGQYMDHHSASSSNGNWQMMDSEASRRPVDPYVGMHPQQPQHAQTHVQPVRAVQSESNAPPSNPSTSAMPNGAFRATPLSLKVEGSQHHPMQNGFTRSHADCNHSTASRDGSHSSSSPTTPDSPSRNPLLPLHVKRSDTSSPAVIKTLVKRSNTSALVKKEGTVEKRIGRRRGPLRPEQRKQAGEIRKLRACLRCKFLKKTCDTGDPCSGCRPSHARLWQVPCTRIGIQDVGYFAKDFKADTDRNYEYDKMNILEVLPGQVGLWVTHGFGYVLPVMTSELRVKDSTRFQLEWTEGKHSNQPKNFKTPSATLKPVEGSISEHIMSEYVDKHIDGGFDRFVDNHFEGTKFITEMLKTVYKYYRSTKLPIVRKGLKLLVAYNLTMHITMAEGVSQGAHWDGKVTSRDSKHYGQTVAPVMVNHEVKRALASLWRNLMKELLAELATLYTSVYTGDKLKHWPTIFMLDTILLAVWEEMQFDVYYAAEKSDDEEAPQHFCQTMEGIPVGVIVGLFLAISQKMPTFLEWDSRKHHAVLNSEVQACDVMTEVREHVVKHEDYLKARSKDCRFDSGDFDSLANKFVSRLVVRAN